MVVHSWWQRIQGIDDGVANLALKARVRVTTQMLSWLLDRFDEPHRCFIAPIRL